MTKLTPISGLGAKGPACFLVETGGARFMLDLGHGPQPGLKPDVSRVGAIDAVLLSHSHPDHAGSLELRSQIGNPPVYATGIVGKLIARDADTQPLPLRAATDVCGVRVTTGRSGHAPGGVWLHLAVGDGVLYMGDSSTESLVYAYDEPPPAATVILDGSYGDYDAPLGETLPRFDAVFDAGAVLMPVPAAGRAADMALYVARRGRGLPHIDDAVRASLRDLANGSSACVRADVVAELDRLAREAPPIERAEGVMLGARGDAVAGKAGELAALWEPESAPAIVFTGYLPPSTPAERLTQSKRARYMRWNVHPRISENAALVRAIGARTVFPAFGDAKHLPAWQTAFAPARVALEGPVSL